LQCYYLSYIGKKSKSFFVDFKIKLIQEIRFIHAISENSNIYLTVDDYKKFQPLIKKFKANIKIGEKSDVNLSKHMNLNHKEPFIEFQSQKNILVFPKSITQYLKKLEFKKKKQS
jgi:hypothetical protein